MFDSRSSEYYAPRVWLIISIIVTAATKPAIPCATVWGVIPGGTIKRVPWHPQYKCRRGAEVRCSRDGRLSVRCL
jgi:hypothetical protein